MKSRPSRWGCIFLLVLMVFGMGCSQSEGKLVNLSRGRQIDELEPVWSPDGSQIAFTGVTVLEDTPSSYKARSDVYVMDADGQNRRLVHMWGHVISWAGDGTSLGIRIDGGLAIVDLDGNELGYLITDEELPDNLYSGPVYSPDGTKMVLTLETGFQPMTAVPLMQLFVADADGRNLTKLSSGDMNGLYPAWSPDGTKIAFFSIVETSPKTIADICVMDADGSNVVRLTDGEGYDGWPAWSPDGKRIAFTSDRDGDTEIYVMNSDGSNVVRLTNNAIIEETLSWSPGGDKLAICGYGASGKKCIYLLSIA